MFVLGNFVNAAAGLIDFVLTIYMWIIIARAVISWVDADPYNPIVRFIYDVTEPPMRKIRQLIPLNMGGIDLTPMALILVIMFLQNFLVPSLRQFAMAL